MPWDRVHAEAEVLEHVLSEELEALIAAKLGNPTHDPHGDPIPSADLVARRGATRRASSTLEPGDRRRRSCASPTPSRRCSATSPRADRARRASCAVVDKQPFGGPLFVDVGGETHALGGQLAASMRVRAA